MKELTQREMMRVNGGDPGTACGLLVGATVGLLLTGNIVGAAFCWMITPAGCALAYG